MPKYNSVDTIPAKVFFHILETKDFQKLKPKPSEQGLEQIFISIYDEFFIKSDNAEAKQYLELTEQIADQKYKIATLKLNLHNQYVNQETISDSEELRELKISMRNDFIEALQIGYNITIDKEQPFINEVERVLTTEIGYLENDLAMLEMNYKSMISNSKQKAFDYEENIVAMENVLNRNINDGIMLDKYIAYGKNVNKVVEQQKQNKK